MTKEVSDATVSPLRVASTPAPVPLRFKKKPDVIQAVRFTRDMATGAQELPAGVDLRSRDYDANGNDLRSHKHVITTGQGEKRLEIGDWIILGQTGQLDICKGDDFLRVYELA